MTSWPNG